MIVGIGVDVVEIKRIQRILLRYSERLPKRLLTDFELKEFQQRGESVSYLASRFAAKEAVSKALGTGISQGIGFRDIEVVNDDKGKPDIVFYGDAKDAVLQRNVSQSFLSLSDEKKYVVAMVILESI